MVQTKLSKQNSLQGKTQRYNLQHEMMNDSSIPEKPCVNSAQEAGADFSNEQNYNPQFAGQYGYLYGRGEEYFQIAQEAQIGNPGYNQEQPRTQHEVSKAFSVLRW